MKLLIDIYAYCLALLTPREPAKVLFLVQPDSEPALPIPFKCSELPLYIPVATEHFENRTGLEVPGQSFMSPYIVN